ncbi:RusA family crossover junction endodeoxyribonuclease [Collinsella sp. AGMB00827]|uniref:RusA family crossover junction endodeoxyribonuclease n=1 Tax=Collinsella ureilytica TaxID=2869515 RepID=A0ABS7MHB9_9ACTN|nr:RusA family crossover junction endodeoxyribonuclease [Collinsella urealyticum]MBY4796755.1 RusA family crossover junction endodeoxyribonuclease [Collinsella urealyticum]
MRNTQSDLRLGSLEFFAPMRRPPTATGANGKRVNTKTGAIFDSDDLAEARTAIEAAISPFVPKKPLHGAIGTEIRWCYPTRGKRAQGEPYTAKPDADNSAKALMDALERLGFIEDDKLVAELHIFQAWSDPSGLYVRLWEI